jgi:hypothetical protein
MKMNLVRPSGAVSFPQSVSFPHSLGFPARRHTCSACPDAGTGGHVPRGDAGVEQAGEGQHPDHGRRGQRRGDSVGIVAAGRMVATGTVADLCSAESGTLRVVVRRPADGWADGLPGTVTVSGDRHILRTTYGDDQEILRRAIKAGHVEHFGHEHPTLTEIFKEAVA